MSKGSIQHDTIDTRLISALLSAQNGPACILKIEGNLATVHQANDEFAKLVIRNPTSREPLPLEALYRDIKASSAITKAILDAVAQKDNQEERIRICLDTSSVESVECSAKFSYLFSETGANYLLHKLIVLDPHATAKPGLPGSSGLYPELLSLTSESIIILDNELSITEFSLQSQKSVREFLGLHLEKGQSIISYLQKDQIPEARKRFASVLSGSIEHDEIQIPRTDERMDKISMTVRPLVDAGVINGIFISAKNVSEKTVMKDILQSREVDLSLIYNHLSETVFMIAVEDNARFRFASVNRAFLKNTGLIESLVVGQLIEDVVPPIYLEATLAQFRKAVSIKAPVIREQAVESPSGIKILLVTITPYCDLSGRCVNIIGSVHDLTKHVNAEKKANENSIRIQGILDSSPDIICTLDGQGILTNVSAASERLLGYSPGLLKNRRLLDLVVHKYRYPTRDFLQAVINGKDTTSFENNLIHKNGSLVPVIWSAHWNSSEQLIYCTVREATEKRIAQQVLLASEKRFKALVHDGSDMIAILDDTATYLYVSPSSKSILDLEPERFLGRNAFEFIHPQDIEKANLEFAQAAGQKKVSLTPFRFRHNNGSWKWIQTVITDLRNSPAIRGFVANSRDVSDIIEAQKSLQVINERYQYVSRATSDAIWDYDLNTGSVLWGEGFLKIFGYSADMLQSDIQTWHNRIHPDDAERVEIKLKAFFESKEFNRRDDYRFLKSDGNYAHVVDKAFLIRDSRGTPLRMIGALQDITIRKKEEARLRVLESVVTNTVDAVIVAKIHPKGERMTKIVFVNKAFEQMTGYRAREVEGRSPWFLQGSGTDRSELEKLIASINGSKPYQGTTINYKKNGGEIWVSYSVTPVADAKGNYTHWIAILRDVTEAKSRELKQMLLASITDIFNRETGLRESVIAMLSKTSEFGKYGFIALWTNNTFSGKLEFTASRFHSDDEGVANSDHSSASSAEHYALQIKNNGKPGHWRITDKRDGLFKNDIKQLRGIPLYRGNTLKGVLLIGTAKTSAFDLSELPENLDTHLATELYRKKLEVDLDNIFNLAPDIIAITDFSGNFKKLNPAASNLLGYTLEELLSRPFSDFLHPDQKQLKLEELANLRQKGNAYYIEEQYLTKEGRSKWLAWTSQPLVGEQLIYSVAKDITEKKELEQLLLNSNSLARIGSWEIDCRENKVAWSDIAREIMGAGLDYIPEPEMPLGEFYPQDAMETVESHIRAARQEGAPWDEVLQIKTLSGKRKWVRSIGSSEFVDGKCLRIFGSLQDIDVQVRSEISAKQARGELEESEKRYSELFHLSPLPMWVYDYETLNFLDVNQTAIANYGYSKTEFLSMNIRDIRPVDELGQLEKTLIKTRKSEGSLFRGIFVHKKKDGETLQVDIKSNTITYKGRKAKVVIANDITERLKQFREIEARNERLREVAWIQSHKVRAPLARLMGLVQLLPGKVVDDAKTEKILDYIGQSAAELDKVIKEVVSKAEELDKPSV